VVSAVIDGKGNISAVGRIKYNTVAHSLRPDEGSCILPQGAHPASAVGLEARGSSNLFRDFHPAEEGGDAMIQSRIAGLVAALTLVTMLGAPALTAAEETFKARLRGFQEVPAISTEASGEFSAKINDDATSIEYILSYQDLTGIVTQGHIHLGQFSVNGGISVWLCQTEDTDPPFRDPTSQAPICPQSGTVTGTITPHNVIGPAGQGIDAGEFAELVDAIRAGVTYANVHTRPQFGGGEIRGQIRRVSINKD
jgi:hypothetical protein